MNYNPTEYNKVLNNLKNLDFKIERKNKISESYVEFYRWGQYTIQLGYREYNKDGFHDKYYVEIYYDSIHLEYKNKTVEFNNLQKAFEYVKTLKMKIAGNLLTEAFAE